MVDCRRDVGTVRQRWLDDADPVVTVENDNARQGVVAKYRFFEDDDVVIGRGTDEEVLGALENEIPPQMR